MCYESPLIKLGRRISKTHPLVRRILVGIYNLSNQISRKLLPIRAIIGKKMFTHSQNLMVNVGGGRWYKRRWKVLDYESEWYAGNAVFIDYNYDLTSRDSMPFGDGTVDFFYSSHTLEHISNEDCQHALDEMYRCLKNAGALRIVVPDIDLIYDKYKERDEKFFEYWMKTNMATSTQAFMILFAEPGKDEGDETIKSKFMTLEKVDFLNYYTKNLRQNPSLAGFHINWFNYQKLEGMLRQAGFQEISKSAAQGSRFKEMRGRGFDTRPTWSLHVEAIKL